MRPVPYSRLAIYSFAGILAVDLLSLSTFFSPQVFHAVWFILVLGVFLLTLRKIELGLLVIALELFVGSHGHLFSYPIAGFALSLRMGFFVAFLLGWLILRWRQRESRALFHSSFFWWGALLLFVVALGTLIGIARGFPIHDVFADMNAFLYLLIAFPAFDLLRNKSTREKLLCIFCVALVYLAFKALLLSALFSHGFDWLPQLYRWLRNTRMYEITAFTQNYYRIFSQAQMFSLLGFLLFFFRAFFHLTKWREHKGDILVCALALLTILLSLSRSYWLVLLLLLVFFVPAVFRRAGWSWRKLFVLGFSFLALLAAELVVISFVANFPYLYGKGVTPFQVLEERSTDRNEVALEHRYQLLLPMLKGAAEHPILGSGFGRTLTFQSSDPRIVAQSGGRRTTFAFEWGFLDIALKTGVLGLFVAVGAGLALFREAWILARRLQELRPLLYGLAAGVLALFLTHVTSPYLNHPIGLGFLLFTAAVVAGIQKSEWKNRQTP